VNIKPAEINNDIYVIISYLITNIIIITSYKYENKLIIQMPRFYKVSENIIADYQLFIFREKYSTTHQIYRHTLIFTRSKTINWNSIF